MQCHRIQMLEEIEVRDLQIIHRSTKCGIEYFQYFMESSCTWLFYEKNSIIFCGRYLTGNLIGRNRLQSVEIRK